MVKLHDIESGLNIKDLKDDILTRIALIYYKRTELPRTWKRFPGNRKYSWIVEHLSPQLRKEFLITIQNWSAGFKRTSFKDNEADIFRYAYK